MVVADILDFENLENLTANILLRADLHHQIGRAVAENSRFLIFQAGGRSHIEFPKIQIFNR